MAAIITSLFFLLTMYLGHEKPCEYKRGKLKTFGAWLLMLLALFYMVLAVSVALKVQDTYNELDYTFELFKMCALLSILMFGWAMYIFKSGPLRSKKWKRVTKSILYFLSSCILLGSSSPDPMAEIMAMIINLVLFFAILLIDVNRKNKRNVLENRQIGMGNPIEEYDIVQTNSVIEWKVIGKCAVKVFATLIMACFLLINGQIDDYKWCHFVASFYDPLYIIFFVYYACLIWSKKDVTGEKMLLLPLLQKIHLFKEYSNSSIAMKKELIKIVLPFLITSIICPFIATLIYWSCNERDLDIYVLLLVIAPILFIINLTKAYAQKWLYSQEQQKDEQK